MALDGQVLPEGGTAARPQRGELLGRALTEHLQQRFHPRPVPAPALAFAREVHETRAQLERVESLTDLTAEEATPDGVLDVEKDLGAGPARASGGGGAEQGAGPTAGARV